MDDRRREKPSRYSYRIRGYGGHLYIRYNVRHHFDENRTGHRQVAIISPSLRNEVSDMDNIADATLATPERTIGNGNGRHVLEIENVSKSFYVYTTHGEKVI